MHEFSLVQGILRTLQGVAAEKRFSTVSEARVVVGDLQSIDTKAFRELLVDEGKRFGFLETEFIVDPEPVSLKCSVCGRRWTPRAGDEPTGVGESIHFVPETSKAFHSCPECGSKDFSILSGRGVYIDYVKGDASD